MAFSNRSKAPDIANTKGVVYVWLWQPYFNELNSSLWAVKGSALFGLQLGSNISNLLQNKAVKVSINLRLWRARKWTWMTLNWPPRPRFKTQSSMFTLFFISLPCSFIVHGRRTVSTFPLDRACVLQNRLFIILSPATAEEASESRANSDNTRIPVLEKVIKHFFYKCQYSEVILVIWTMLCVCLEPGQRLKVNTAKWNSSAI